MLSLFSKSFKTVESEPSSSCREMSQEPSDVRSCVNVSQINRLKKERRFFKGRHIRSSDFEDDIKSVVSDNPQMYRCSNSNRKQRNQLLNPKKAKKSFDTVERKMNHIQASLSTVDLLSSSQHNRATDSCTVEKLRQDLEGKEIFANKLQDQLDNINSKNGSIDVKELDDILARKRRQIKKKKDKLKPLQDDGNIDVKISLAEMEYSLEKDQIEMLNLSQKIQTARVAGVKARAVQEMSRQESLYTAVQAGQVCLVAAISLDREDLGGLVTRQEGFGLEVGEEWAGSRLQAGDRVIEMNGENVLRLLSSSWPPLLAQLRSPVKVVVLRSLPSSPAIQAGHVTGLKEDIALIQSRLSEKLQEGRTVSLELSAVQQQRDKLGSDNTRLRHRIQYLEDQVTHLEAGMKQVRDSLAQTLNTEIMETIHKLEKVGCDLEAGLGGEHSSSSTSGIYSGEGSEGSNSPQYKSWRSGYVARLVIGEESSEGRQRNNSARRFIKWPGGQGRAKQEKSNKIFVSHTSSQV